MSLVKHFLVCELLCYYVLRFYHYFIMNRVHEPGNRADNIITV